MLRYCLLVLSVAWSRAADTTSKVMIHIPFDIHKPAGFDHVQAQFGFRSSAGDIAEYVYFVEDPLCNPLVHHKNATNDATGFPSRKETPFILLVNDGECSSVTKARHAQMAGAAALVIADSRCRCSDEDCADHVDCEEEEPQLTDDGSGSDVTIPSFLLNKPTADVVKEQLKANQPVLMQLLWGLKLKNNTQIPIYWHLWRTAHDPLVDLETYRNLHLVWKAFGTRTTFSPRYALIDGNKFGCLGNEKTCDHMCTNGGRYCTVHDPNLSGFAVVKETLRQLCIWKQYGDDKPEVWWDYIIYHKTNCFGTDKFAEDACLNDSLSAAKVNKPLVDDCMKNSGGVDDDVVNSLLDEQLAKRKESSVVSLPTLTLDRKNLEHFSSFSLFETICWKFWYSNVDDIPEICYTCGDCPNKIGCVEEGHCVGFNKKERFPEHDESSDPKKKSKQKKSHGWRGFWFMSFLAICGGAYYYYKQQQDQFGSSRPSINSYFQLTGEG